MLEGVCRKNKDVNPLENRYASNWVFHKHGKFGTHMHSKVNATGK